MRFVVLSLCLLALLIAAIGSTELAAQVADRLPGEGELPGQTVDASELPDEGMLPGSAKSSDALPGEDQLPGRGPESLPNESAPIGGYAPILRLAFEGHTGAIRTLDISDGGRTLVTAGEDKEVHVWRRTDLTKNGWLHRRTIRWPITRGPRGVVYTAQLKGDLVAFAGYGAYATNGEIRVVDVATGDLTRTLVLGQDGHQSNVLSLSWSPGEEPRLASVNMQGRLVVWQIDATTGFWNPTTLVEADDKTYSPAEAAALASAERRTFVPVQFVGPDYVVVPRYVGPSQGDAAWHLQRVDLRTGQSVLLNNLNHIKHVRSMAATDDGRRLATCDWRGSVGVWTFQNGAIAKFDTFKPDEFPNVVKFDASGDRLLIGSDLVVNAEDGPPVASIQLWDLSGDKPTLTSKKAVDRRVLAGVIDTQRREVLVTQENQIHSFAFNDEGKFLDGPPKRLTAPTGAIANVAFAKDGPPYKIAIGTDDEGAFDDVFDLTQSKLQGRLPVDADGFLPAGQLEPAWSFDEPSPGKFRLLQGDQPRGTLPLTIDANGTPTAIATSSGFVFVGTRGNNNIYAYRADETDPAKLMRQFRDHTGAVTSIGVSADGNYMVSGSEDAMISIWNLQGIESVGEMVNRWGCDFVVESDSLVATEVREDGPLYFRGVRGGDVLVSIGWVDKASEEDGETDPAKMRQRLLDLPFDLMLELKFKRLRSAGPHFNSFPAWRPIATLFVDQDRQWAYWTPAGYYDASFGGHRHFGWQINKAIDQPVEYFQAAQFRKALERPDVMRRLLAAGSLPAAMRKTVTQIGPPPGQDAIVNQYLSKPTIRLLSPTPGKTIEGDELTVRAEIRTPVGATLVDPKAFVSGVPAVSRQVVANVTSDETASDSANLVTYQWRFRLPRDRQLQLEILAATQAESLDRILVDFDHVAGPPAETKPRMHVLAIGVGEYRDPQIQSLDFAADAAGKVAEMFRRRSESLYDISADQLIDTDATRPLWRVFASDAAERLRQSVSPDDLVIMYLCGHGLRDRRTNQWYFVTADARYSDLMSDRYEDCIAFSDLAVLASLPCRKLAILDSCHSGAVQPLMRSDDLKSALRFLQEDVVLTLTASEGDEEAAEQQEMRMGRFTAAMVDGLSGAADRADGVGNGDDVVSLNELIGFVTRRVTADSEAEGIPQHPTASPQYLLRTLALPLTAKQ